MLLLFDTRLVIADSETISGNGSVTAQGVSAFGGSATLVGLGSLSSYGISWGESPGHILKITAGNFVIVSSSHLSPIATERVNSTIDGHLAVVRPAHVVED